MTAHDLAFPFARELHEQHDALRTTARWIEAEVSRLRHSQHREGFLLVPLRAFAHELGEHFRFEERHAFGLRSGPDAQAALPGPARHEALLAFTEEHRVFERRLASILVRLQAGETLDSLVSPDILADLKGFFDDLRRHDARESAFVAHPEGPADPDGVCR
jgi:hemerythrin-like domain-containing protein